MPVQAPVTQDREDWSGEQEAGGRRKERTFHVGTTVREDELLQAFLLNDLHLVVVEVVRLVDLLPDAIRDTDLL